MQPASAYSAEFGTNERWGCLNSRGLWRVCGTIRHVSAHGPHPTDATPAPRRNYGDARRITRWLAAIAGTLVIATATVTVPPRDASAQASSGTPWPIVTAAITPPEVSAARVAPAVASTAVPLPPIAEDPADDAAAPRRSRVGYAVAGLLGAIGAGMYGWSAWKRLRAAT